MSRIFEHAIKVTLREEDHRYFDQNGQEYISQSKFMEQFKNKFPTEFASKNSAIKQLRKEGVPFTGDDIDQLQGEIKEGWNKNNKNARDHGNNIHNPLEMYGKGHHDKVDKSFIPLCQAVYADHLSAGRWWNEQVVFLTYPYIAGTMDLPVARTSSFNPIMDIDDFKTNINRGIEFRDPYKKFMKFPIDHLEDCNYNHYALQLSLYGYMLKATFGLRVGSLNIRYIKADVKDGVLKSWEMVKYPVPFMLYEIESMLEWHVATIEAKQ